MQQLAKLRVEGNNTAQSDGRTLADQINARFDV